jgi:hypothetical protein
MNDIDQENNRDLINQNIEKQVDELMKEENIKKGWKSPK